MDTKLYLCTSRYARVGQAYSQRGHGEWHHFLALRVLDGATVACHRVVNARGVAVDHLFRHVPECVDEVCLLGAYGSRFNNMYNYLQSLYFNCSGEAAYGLTDHATGALVTTAETPASFTAQTPQCHAMHEFYHTEVDHVLPLSLLLEAPWLTLPAYASNAAAMATE